MRLLSAKVLNVVLMLRWGWLVLTLSGIGVLLLITAGSVGWWWYTKGKHEYEPLEGEEEE